MVQSLPKSAALPVVLARQDSRSLEWAASPQDAQAIPRCGRASVDSVDVRLMAAVIFVVYLHLLDGSTCRTLMNVRSRTQNSKRYGILVPWSAALFFCPRRVGAMPQLE